MSWSEILVRLLRAFLSLSVAAIFIICCGWGLKIRSLHYVPLTWSSHAGLS